MQYVALDWLDPGFSKAVEQPKCPSPNEGINQMYFYTKYCSAKKGMK